METNLYLLDLDQDAFCKVIEQLQPIQSRQLIDLLEISQEFTERVLNCVYSIDLSSGEPLTMKSGLPSEHVNPGEAEYDAELLVSKLFDPSDLIIVTTRPYDADDDEEPDVTLYLDKYRKIVSAFPHLREYRVLFQPYEELDGDPRQLDDLEFLIRDVRARWLCFLSVDWNPRLIKSIVDGLRSRVERYGSKFTFVYETNKYSLSFVDGTLILNFTRQLPDDMKKELLTIIYSLHSVIRSFGSNDSKILGDILGLTIMTHVKHVIMFGNSQFDEEGRTLEFWETFRIEHLYPHLIRLTELEFRVGVEFIEFPSQFPYSYMSSLLSRGNQNPGLSFPNITKFEIPIPLSGTVIAILKRLFPNVPRFYHIEEYQLASQSYYLQDNLAMQYSNLDNVTPQIKTIE
jgi:hypothetical protein